LSLQSGEFGAVVVVAVAVIVAALQLAEVGVADAVAGAAASL
jgi:hypothetical protein